MIKECPLGWECHKCKWNVRLRGKNPQSNQEIDREDCAIAWLPVLLVEVSQMNRQTAISVESVREHPAFQLIAEAAKMHTNKQVAERKVKVIE